MPKLFTTYHISIFGYITTLCWIWFMYRSYIGKVIGCGIFQYYNGSFGSLLGHFTCFFKGASGLPLLVLLFNMLNFDCFCIFHSSPIEWSFFFNAVAHVEIDIFSFQLALWDTQTLLPQVVCSHVPPFENLVV